MTLYLQDPDVTLYNGDALETLRQLPDRSVHMCATSPPFYGLRDYGTGTWEGGDEGCDHVKATTGIHRDHSGDIRVKPKHDEQQAYTGISYQYGTECGKCGARRIDRQIGLEESPDEWVARLVEVFREVRRVLRDDGTLWVELGDSYNSGTSARRGATTTAEHGRWENGELAERVDVVGIKPKDLLGQPWLLAFALRADGWFLRSEIIWARPNPMPESVTDRPTKAHSTVFLLSKKPRYYYDQEAIREPHKEPERGANGVRVGTIDERPEPGVRTGTLNSIDRGGPRAYNPAGANARSVWTIPTEPTPFAHFATWPQALVRRMILAGTSERGVCPECGGPWVRETEHGEVTSRGGSAQGARAADLRSGASSSPLGQKVENAYNTGEFVARSKITTGWRPSCGEDRDVVGDRIWPIPATVLDPFGGSGTTALVARKLGRRAVLIELNESYCQLASERLSQQSLFATEGMG